MYPNRRAFERKAFHTARRASYHTGPGESSAIGGCLSFVFVFLFVVCPIIAIISALAH